MISAAACGPFATAKGVLFTRLGRRRWVAPTFRRGRVLKRPGYYWRVKYGDPGIPPRDWWLERFPRKCGQPDCVVLRLTGRACACCPYCAVVLSWTRP